MRSVAGTGTSQRDLKRNTITSPQDIVKISDSLPADPSILVDTIKVVFIGSGVPSKEMLKKVYAVRREVVYNALTFLVQNHPLYTNIRISHYVHLPDDGIPDQIWTTIAVHEGAYEDKKEHANYTPQTDIVLPSEAENDGTVVKDSTGILDLEGWSVVVRQEPTVHSLQGTMYVHHGSLPVTDYNIALDWCLSLAVSLW